MENENVETWQYVSGEALSDAALSDDVLREAILTDGKPIVLNRVNVAIGTIDTEQTDAKNVLLDELIAAADSEKWETAHELIDDLSEQSTVAPPTESDCQPDTFLAIYADRIHKPPKKSERTAKGNKFIDSSHKKTIHPYDENEKPTEIGKAHYVIAENILTGQRSAKIFGRDVNASSWRYDTIPYRTGDLVTAAIYRAIGLDDLADRPNTPGEGGGGTRRGLITLLRAQFPASVCGKDSRNKK